MTYADVVEVGALQRPGLTTSTVDKAFSAHLSCNHS